MSTHMKSNAAGNASRRSAGPSYQDILNLDTHPVPPVMRRQGASDYGTADIPVDRYIDRKFHELEKQRLWPKVWQVATREENIPNVGDVDVYQIMGISIIVVRTASDTIKAFFNACLHQGRLIIDKPGHVQELRCPFHGFCWNLDGRSTRISGQWDYPQIDKQKFNLPEVKVGRWGGFVFINMDPQAQSLEAYLGGLDEHFERYPLSERFTVARVAKIFRANWKTVQEAFMESFHVIATHPQILASTGDENTQYDGFGNFSRAMSATGVPSPTLRWKPTEDDMAAISFNTEDPTAARAPSIPPGQTFRTHAASAARDRLRPVIGAKADELCDSELMDSFFFTVFPNFHPWSAYNHIAYRFTPYGDNHDMAIMETWLLAPFKGKRPPPARLRELGPDQSHLEAPELGMLARIFHQDEANIENVQKGMHTLRMTKPGTTLGAYQYGKIRHFHTLYEKYLSEQP